MVVFKDIIGFLDKVCKGYEIICKVDRKWIMYIKDEKKVYLLNVWLSLCLVIGVE